MQSKPAPRLDVLHGTRMPQVCSADGGRDFDIAGRDVA
jgi:hypothetical protein